MQISKTIALAAGVAFLASCGQASTDSVESEKVWGDDVASVMCQQFSIAGATKTVEAAAELSDDFSTAHHGPQNIPIEVSIPADQASFTHFPILESGEYLIYTDTPDRIADIELKDGESLTFEEVDAPKGCADALTGGVKVTIGDDKVTGPMPVAIEYASGPAATIKLISSRSPIN